MSNIPVIYSWEMQSDELRIVARKEDVKFFVKQSAREKRRDFSPTQADKEILFEPEDKQEGKDDDKPLHFFDSQGVGV